MVYQYAKENYNLPYHMIEQVDQQIKQMVQDGIIEEYQTEYISPHVHIRKKSGILLLCIDGRFINEKLMNYPITRKTMGVISRNVTKSRYFPR